MNPGIQLRVPTAWSPRVRSAARAAARSAAGPAAARAAAFAGVVFGCAFGAAAAHAQSFDFTMAVIPAPGDAYSSLISTVPARFAKATAGRVKVTISDSLVPGAQIVSAVRDGRVDMSAALHTYLAAEEPRFSIFNLPGLIGGMPDPRR